MRGTVVLGAACLMALVAIILAGPDDDTASVGFILENHGPGSIVIHQFVFPEQRGRRAHTFGVGGLLRPGPALARQMPGHLNFPPGPQKMILVWTILPDSDGGFEPTAHHRRTVTFDPVLRRMCWITFYIRFEEIEVSSCRNQTNRSWFNEYWD